MPTLLPAIKALADITSINEIRRGLAAGWKYATPIRNMLHPSSPFIESAKAMPKQTLDGEEGKGLGEVVVKAEMENGQVTEINGLNGIAGTLKAEFNNAAAVGGSTGGPRLPAGDENGGSDGKRAGKGTACVPGKEAPSPPTTAAKRKRDKQPRADGAWCDKAGPASARQNVVGHAQPIRDLASRTRGRIRRADNSKSAPKPLEDGSKGIVKSDEMSNYNAPSASRSLKATAPATGADTIGEAFSARDPSRGNADSIDKEPPSRLTGRSENTSVSVSPLQNQYQHPPRQEQGLVAATPLATIAPEALDEKVRGLGVRRI